MKGVLALRIVLASAVGMTTGCQPIVPPEEAVLAGTWTLETTAQAGLDPTTLTFDGEGRLVRISIQKSPTIRVEPVILDSSTDVNGLAVTIRANFMALDTFQFTGALDEAMAVASGHLTTNINVGVAKIIIDRGSATLTRQP